MQQRSASKYSAAAMCAGSANCAPAVLVHGQLGLDLPGVVSQVDALRQRLFDQVVLLEARQVGVDAVEVAGRSGHGQPAVIAVAIAVAAAAVTVTARCTWPNRGQHRRCRAQQRGRGF